MGWWTSDVHQVRRRNKGSSGQAPRNYRSSPWYDYAHLGYARYRHHRPLVLSRPEGQGIEPMFRLGSALLLRCNSGQVTTGRSDKMKARFHLAPRLAGEAGSLAAINSTVPLFCDDSQDII